MTNLKSNHELLSAKSSRKFTPGSGLYSGADLSLLVVSFDFLFVSYIIHDFTFGYTKSSFNYSRFFREKIILKSIIRECKYCLFRKCNVLIRENSFCINSSIGISLNMFFNN